MMKSIILLLKKITNIMLISENNDYYEPKKFI